MLCLYYFLLLISVEKKFGENFIAIASCLLVHCLCIAVIYEDWQFNF